MDQYLEFRRALNSHRTLEDGTPRWCTTGVLSARFLRALLSLPKFLLQNAAFSEWAMLGSNQRPLPCEVRASLSWLFTTVQKYPQNWHFRLMLLHGCSSSFVWVGVLLVYERHEFAPRFDISKRSEVRSSELSQGAFQNLFPTGVRITIVGLAGYLYLLVIRCADWSR